MHYISPVAFKRNCFNVIWTYSKVIMQFHILISYTHMHFVVFFCIISAKKMYFRHCLCFDRSRMTEKKLVLVGDHYWITQNAAVQVWGLLVCIRTSLCLRWVATNPLQCPIQQQKTQWKHSAVLPKIGFGHRSPTGGNASTPHTTFLNGCIFFLSAAEAVRNAKYLFIFNNIYLIKILLQRM